MAKLCLFVLGCVTFLRAAVCLLSPSEGENVTPPTNVTFQKEFFVHVLTWNHDKTNDDGILYEVEYRSYGSNWTSVPHCRYIRQQSCDLTEETLPESLGYIGRVRSILGNQTSAWSRSTRYTISEVNLPPPHVQLKVNGPSLHVQLILPKITKNHITRDYKDVFPFNRIYKVSIRRTKDNHMATISDFRNESCTVLTWMSVILLLQSIGATSTALFIAQEQIDLVKSRLVDSDILPRRPPLGFGMDGRTSFHILPTVMALTCSLTIFLAEIPLSKSWMLLLLFSWEIFFMAAPGFKPVTFCLGINLITH